MNPSTYKNPVVEFNTTNLYGLEESRNGGARGLRDHSRASGGILRWREIGNAYSRRAYSVRHDLLRG